VLDLRSMGESIRARRKELGITQKELSKMTNIAQGHVVARPWGFESPLQHHCYIRAYGPFSFYLPLRVMWDLLTF